MGLAAVTLDAGGTLFEVAEPVGATYARVAERHGMTLAAAEAERRFRESFAAAPPLAFPGRSPVRLAEDERAWWYAIVQKAFGRAAAAGFDACFADLFAHYARPEAWRVFPDACEGLARVRARGLRVAVVSNFDERLIGLVAGLGLAPLVDLVMPSTRAGAAKPDPAIFRAALAALGVAHERAAHVGDDLVADVDGARAAGLRAVLIDRAGRQPAVPPGVPRIGTLAELPAVLGPVFA